MNGLCICTGICKLSIKLFCVLFSIILTYVYIVNCSVGATLYLRVVYKNFLKSNIIAYTQFDNTIAKIDIIFLYTLHVQSFRVTSC